MSDFAIIFIDVFADVFIDLLPLFAHHSESRYFPMYSQVSKAWHEVFHKSHSILYIDEYLHSIETLEWALSSGGRCTKFTCEIVGLRTSNFAHFDEAMCPVPMISKPYNNGKREKSSLSMEWISGYKKSISLTNLIVRQSPMNVLIHAIENLGFEHDDTTIAAAFTGTDTEKIDYILNLSSIKKNFMLARMAAKYGGRDTVDHIINKYKLRVKPSTIDRNLVKHGSYVGGVQWDHKYVNLLWAKAIIRDDIQFLKDTLLRIGQPAYQYELQKLTKGYVASREFLVTVLGFADRKDIPVRLATYLRGAIFYDLSSSFIKNMDLVPADVMKSQVRMFALHSRNNSELENLAIDSSIRFSSVYYYLMNCIEYNQLSMFVTMINRVRDSLSNADIKNLAIKSVEHRRFRIAECMNSWKR